MIGNVAFRTHEQIICRYGVNGITVRSEIRPAESAVSSKVCRRIFKRNILNIAVVVDVHGNAVIGIYYFCIRPLYCFGLAVVSGNAAGMSFSLNTPTA